MVGQGEIDSHTLSNFRSALLKGTKKNRLEPSDLSLTVVLSSLGGSLAAGLQLGREIRRLNFDTRAVSDLDHVITVKGGYEEKPLLRHAKCLSACAYAFLGGSTRSVESDSVLGVHQFKSTTTVSESDVQSAGAQLSIYVEEMGISQRFVTIAALTHSNEITYLDKVTAYSLAVDNVQVLLTPWTVGVTKDGFPSLKVVQSKSPSVGVKIAVIFTDGRVFVGTRTSLKIKSMSRSRIANFPENEAPTLTFEVDGKIFKGKGIEKWKKSIDSEDISYTSVSVFLPALLQALKAARKVVISDNFGTASSDISMDTELSTVGLESGIALLSRAK